MKSEDIEKAKFLDPATTRSIAEKFGTPVFVYSESALKARAEEMLAFKAPFGLTVRFAMKASSNVNILKYFKSLGIKIDASSGYEVERAILAGVAPEDILLTAQELAHNLPEIIEKGVKFNATNLRQLEAYGKSFPGTSLGVRINPGLGSGGNNRTNTGGPASSFGIWHEYIPQVKEIAAKYSLKVIRVHTHIGSGSDPVVWENVNKLSVALLDHFKEAEILSLGGGFKVGRMSYEPSADISKISESASALVKSYSEKTGRKIHIEVEPGTYLMANSAALISRIDSIADTGKDGYKFYVVNAGLTEVTRPALYGAQHPLIVVSKDSKEDSNSSTEEVIVPGHCCESGDMFTTEPGDPEGLKPRKLKKAEVGDYLIVDSVGAYCSAMSLKNYNSFPETAEVWLKTDGKVELIRKKQTLDQILANEVSIF